MKDNWENHKKESYVEDFHNKQNIETQSEGYNSKLEFGTAGIRGKFGLGEGRLNKFTIGKVALGIANYLNSQTKSPSVVIYFDTRHLSYEFTNLIAEILATKNIKVYISNEYRSTPELSFAVRYLKATAGIMITASHNPKDYNGIKVYGSDGAQLDTDSSIVLSGYIDALGDPLNIAMKINVHKSKKHVHLIKDEVRESYIKHVTNSVGTIHESNLKVVFSSLHGTSVPIVPTILERLKFKSFSLVENQCMPDPDFSSVDSANPEDYKAFDKAIEEARKIQAGLLICTDPDADRVGIVEIDNDGNVYYYNGNEIGALLLNYRIKETSHLNNRVMIQSIVTSELGKSIAKANNVLIKEVLTGFKFIAKEIRNFSPEYNFIFGYEESYGYLAEPFVRDKDAIQIVPLIIKYASELKNTGRMFKDELNNIYKIVGKHNDKLFSQIFEGENGKSKIDRIMSEMRIHPPKSIAGLSVIRVEDYKKQERLESGRVTKINLPKADVLKIYFESGFIALRPSGTEPKIKLYVSLKSDNFEYLADEINKSIFEL
ncbi:phospho-sugar mutase [Staphylococcus pseudoxylosus]|uniref:phospho-sugar mutase n=1 Tax=Staphylococcus pseudoxylosus TaxID=2282419 RepID=UPI002DBB4EB6|nr:phospho-sugar mutase [Staphylococcus pseudoxylosus]MEB6045027.1 phospho-sugar mutase [Staphylococcus pseudoxylosus]MEB8007906.1 phospho-sugar mutase [Staphylococcus pseudoxylosus]